MQGEYSDEWAELRGLRHRTFVAVLAAALVLGIVPLMTSFMPPSRFRGVVALGLLAAWVWALIRLFLAWLTYVFWPCPRCGKAFHRLDWWLSRWWINPFARRCVNCGLPKWVDSDPDPRLKAELDPFRSDSTFKLGQ